MKMYITQYDFRNAFNVFRPENFSYEGLGALYDYLIDYEEGTGEELELDVIALCCDFTEYDSLEEAFKDYEGIETLEELTDNTSVIPVEGGGLIVHNF